MMKDKGDFLVGNVMVSTTHNKGHDPEFWAGEVTKKICSIQRALHHIYECKPRLSGITYIR